MRRKDLDYLVIAALLVSGLYVAISGLVSDVFGFPQFAFHSTAGYVSTVLATVHLALNWRRVTAYLRRRLKRSRRRERSETLAAEYAPAPGRRTVLISGLAAVGGFILGFLLPDGRSVECPDETTDLGMLYHQWSKPGYSQALGALLDWGAQPAQYKTYPDAQQILLPDPWADSPGSGEMTVEGALDMRRSVRDYVSEPLPLVQLSRLLYAAQGITAERSGFRAAPSAGALYPIELYAVVHHVAGLEPGIYHYAAQVHGLELLRAQDFRTPIVRAGLGQAFLGQANVCFVLSAIFQRTRWKYRERAYRYVMLEAGHVGQNFCLAATAMGLGACPVGAFLDDAVNDLLGVNGEDEAALYVISVGMG